MNQLTFDLSQALEARDDGLRRVAENNQEFLTVARATAREVALTKPGGRITAEDVRKACVVEPTHPNCWGVLFNTADWEPTSERVQSSLKQGHGNWIRVWRLKR